MDSEQKQEILFIVISLIFTIIFFGLCFKYQSRKVENSIVAEQESYIARAIQENGVNEECHKERE